jgi:hypothetical protein
MKIQIKSGVLRLLVCFGAAFLTAILLRTAIHGSNITQSLGQASVIALSITLALAWFERPRHPRH